jgi:hypothetical protein
VVTGYPGGNEVGLAMERGEVQGRATTWESWSGSNPDWLRDKKIIQLLQLGPKKLPEIGNDVPLLRDLVSDPEQKAIVDLVGLSLAMGRSVYVPPETPADRVAALREAFVATMKDPGYIADAKKFNLDTTTWQTGEPPWICRDISPPRAGSDQHRDGYIFASSLHGDSSSSMTACE